ncbi:hypothetical protein QEV83_13765 [Methylocapsa sp. D3K7]|uniref:hypothetical protein n=1 Tax=Methylocapsa sp. D3K7 TaxID=3041435 RepID=UPI00244E7EAC|nr:hypothetical protein [Methylocapsa sp. D3K7]WGJ13744.1 hypothetical protein QEV83_13765 [Methylocapsa sp. D3K7]
MSTEKTSPAARGRGMSHFRIEPEDQDLDIHLWLDVESSMDFLVELSTPENRMHHQERCTFFKLRIAAMPLEFQEMVSAERMERTRLKAMGGRIDGAHWIPTGPVASVILDGGTLVSRGCNGWSVVGCSDEIDHAIVDLKVATAGLDYDAEDSHAGLRKLARLLERAGVTAEMLFAEAV